VSPEAPGSPPQTPRVLVVDDDRGMRMIAGAALGAAGFAVETAEDVPAARAALETFRPDIVLLDVDLPGVDGITLCRQLHLDPKTREIPVCMMTGLNDLASIQRAYEAGATDFVIKPPNWVILGQRLRYIRRASLAARQLAEANRELTLAGVVFEHIPEGVVITDRDAVIISVNPAFTAINGYTAAEAVGRKANLLQSGRHPDDFYRDMWQCLTATGSWRGEVWNRRKSGELYPALLAISSLRDDTGAVSRYIGTLQDISYAKESEERIRFLAYHDLLTGLPNRLLFRDRTELAINHAKRDKVKCVLVFLDLDGFKKVNDTLGHESGDELLVDVAKRLRKHIRVEDTVARLGGDEFLILLSRVRDEQAVLLVIEKVLQALAEPYTVRGSEITITASMGVSVYPNDGASCEELLKAADTAMYRAKETGKKGYVIFSQEMTDRVQRRVGLENRLRRAIGENRLSVHFQPRYDLRNRRIVSAEALVRWEENGVFIPPLEFIPIAEESGLVIPLGERVLEEACRRARGWLDRGAAGLGVSVNVSPVQLLQRDFCARVEAILAGTGLPPALLELEITESIFVNNLEEIAGTLTYLHNAGVRFALDDFGTGYSSLLYLKKLPIRVLKIDRSFVKDLESSEDSRVIIQTIISMAQVLDIGVVAEGVETLFQEEFVRENCGERDAQGQGYLFSRPVPPEAFERLLFPQ
jgi:diguanylate cyclase (GGDEF)-like protein/PAS domain S-box-containing protein